MAAVTTTNPQWQTCQEIKRVTENACSRFKDNTCSTKFSYVEQALMRLVEAVRSKYMSKSSVEKESFAPEINLKQLGILDLTTVDAMLDAEIQIYTTEIEPSLEPAVEHNGIRTGFTKQISLRTALSISRSNILNLMFGTTFGLMYGKTEALKEVETALSSYKSTE